MPVGLALFQGLSEGGLEEAAQENLQILNVGHGGMQIRHTGHTSRSVEAKEQFERNQRIIDEDEGMKQFFKLFQESTFEESRAAALEMRTIAERQDKFNQKFLLFHSLHFLARSDLKMLSWPNSPLLVLLQFVDPNVLSGGLREGELREPLLHDLVDVAAPSDYSSHEIQLILAKQLVDYGANVNALSNVGRTPLHKACFAGVVTNLDFVEFLLEAGACPNAQDPLGITALMFTMKCAPGAANFLLHWPTTNVHLTNRAGESYLDRVEEAVKLLSDEIALPYNPEKDQFLLQQWRDIEEILVQRGCVSGRHYHAPSI
jgi:hypothetical protein